MGEGRSQQPDKRAQHMQRRRDQGVSYRKLGDEFHTSKSTAHRTLKKKGKVQKVKTDRGDFAFKNHNKRKGD